MAQTDLKPFQSPSYFDGDDALIFPSTDGIFNITAVSSATVNVTTAPSSQAKYAILNANADFWMLIGSTSVSATIPGTTNVTDGSGSLLVKYQGGSDRTFALTPSTGCAISSVSTSTSFKMSISWYTD